MAASEEVLSVSDGSGVELPEEPESSHFYARVLVIIGLVVLAGIVLVGVNFAFLRHWLAVHTGTVPSNNPAWYNFWSGFGSDLGEATLVTAVVAGVWTGLRKSNCHVKGCWRLGHFPLEHTPFHLCHKHHPAVVGELTQAAILKQHLRRREDYEARHPRSHAQVSGGATEHAPR